ncbi:MAG: hypothetical protein KIT14_03405 [bacterium]|nr:hypothetical protein [bacterium]
MQKVAAYLFEHSGWSALAAEERKRVEQLVNDRVATWLRSKGGDPAVTSGGYKPEDGSIGTYRVADAADGDSTWWMLELHEDAPAGRRFSVAVSVVRTNERVVVYVTLETGWTTTHIMPVEVDPKCPRIVRDLLALPVTWRHGSSVLQGCQRANSFDAGELLANTISDPQRTVPIVLISTHGGYCSLPDLDVKLSHDLVGLANVFIVNDEASWALRDALGPQWGCYRGAVRLFWPHFSRVDDRYRHPLWTAERLVSASDDAVQTRERFRRQLRALLFRTSAVSVIRPPEIDAIRDAGSRRALLEHKERAQSLEEYRALADLYAVENDALRQDRDELRSRVEELAAEVSRLDGDRQALLSHLNAAKAKEASGLSPDDIAPDSQEQGETTPPEPGEIRFYKKTYAKPGYDVVVPVGDCGHNKWEGAHAADKARKGIARLEGERSWQTLQHCASCTGGGMWRVRW